MDLHFLGIPYFSLPILQSSPCILTFLSFKFCRKQQKKNSLWMICRVSITMLKVPWFVVLFIYIFFWFHWQLLTVYWLCSQPVIFLPVCPASLTHKNPQRRKIIHGMHPAGFKDQSIDLNMCICRNIPFM